MIVNFGKHHEITFPVYRIPDGHIEEKDGIVFLNNMVLDNKNKTHKYFGQRRLATHAAFELYPLRDNIASMSGIIHNKNGTRYIDRTGKIFVYNRSKKATVISCRIRDLEPKDGLATVMSVWGIEQQFVLNRPPDRKCKWASIIFVGDFPWIPLEFSEEEQKTRRIYV